MFLCVKYSTKNPDKICLKANLATVIKAHLEYDKMELYISI